MSSIIKIMAESFKVKGDTTFIVIDHKDEVMVVKVPTTSIQWAVQEKPSDFIVDKHIPMKDPFDVFDTGRGFHDPPDNFSDEDVGEEDTFGEALKHQALPDDSLEDLFDDEVAEEDDTFGGEYDDTSAVVHIDDAPEPVEVKDQVDLPFRANGDVVATNTYTSAEMKAVNRHWIRQVKAERYDLAGEIVEELSKVNFSNLNDNRHVIHDRLRMEIAKKISSGYPHGMDDEGANHIPQHLAAFVREDPDWAKEQQKLSVRARPAKMSDASANLNSNIKGRRNTKQVASSMGQKVEKLSLRDIIKKEGLPS